MHSEIYLLAALSLIAGFSLNEASQILVGFIQVSGLKFYKDFCPDADKKKWFENFKALLAYKVLT